MPEIFNQNVSNFRFVGWDVETTGNKPKQDYLVEIAAIAFDEEFEHRCFDRLVRPPVEIPSEVIAIHGITNEMVRSAEQSEQVLPEFIHFLENVGGQPLLLAHNAAFDLEVVGQEFRRHFNNKVKLETPFVVLDSCMLAKMLLPTLKTHRLQALVEHFNLPQEKLHRALVDVRALNGVFLKLLSIAADHVVARGEELTLSKLIDLAGGYFIFHPKHATPVFKLPPRIEELENLCGSDTKVAIAYENAENYRYITPLEVRVQHFKVYIKALCHRDDIIKTFRADKILSVKKEKI